MENQINQFIEIILIIDFERLSLELETDKLKSITDKVYSNIENIYNKKFNLIIKNSLVTIQENLNPIEFPNKLILNKLEIDDELYVLSPILGDLFLSLEVNELIYKNLNLIQNHNQPNFRNFILNDQNDEEYKDLDIYISYIEGVIVIDNNYTAINSLIMLDCPLFAITGNMFIYKEIETEYSQIFIKRY